jgi:hypothetical protein
MPYNNLWPVQLYNIFHHYFTNCVIKKKLLNTKCVFWFSLQLLSETFLILRRKEQDMSKSVHWSPCKVPITLVNVSWCCLNFLDRFFQNTQISNFMKILWVLSWVVRCRQMDGWRDTQTDIMKLTAPLRNFANKPKKQMSQDIWCTVCNCNKKLQRRYY